MYRKAFWIFLLGKCFDSEIERAPLETFTDYVLNNLKKVSSFLNFTRIQDYVLIAYGCSIASAKVLFENNDEGNKEGRVSILPYWN